MVAVFILLPLWKFFHTSFNTGSFTRVSDHKSSLISSVLLGILANFNIVVWMVLILASIFQVFESLGGTYTKNGNLLQAQRPQLVLPPLSYSLAFFKFSVKVQVFIFLFGVFYYLLIKVKIEEKKTFIKIHKVANSFFFFLSETKGFGLLSSSL